ncbi:hypothetical protein ACHAXT_011350 [Thalassiosira profunda]
MAIIHNADKRGKTVCLFMAETAFCITAFFLMFIGALRCDFVKFTDTSDVFADPPSLQFGMWRWQSYTVATNFDGTFIFESCVGYPEYQDVDATWKTAQAFSIMTFIMGFIVLIFSCVFACTIDAEAENVSKQMWVPVLYLVTGLFQGLSLLLLSSNACNDNLVVKRADAESLATFPDTCSLNTGANLIISATVFWFCAAFAAIGARKIEGSMEDDGEEDAAKVEESAAVEASKAEEGAAAEEAVPEQAAE